MLETTNDGEECNFYEELKLALKNFQSKHEKYKKYLTELADLWNCVGHFNDIPETLDIGQGTITGNWKKSKEDTCKLPNNIYKVTYSGKSRKREPIDVAAKVVECSKDWAAIERDHNTALGSDYIVKFYGGWFFT